MGLKLHKEELRLRDPDLMEAVESYISTRKRRRLNLGDAEGLSFTTSRAARNKVSRDKSFQKRFGAAKGKVIAEGVRQIEREARRARRTTTKKNPPAP